MTNIGRVFLQTMAVELIFACDVSACFHVYMVAAVDRLVPQRADRLNLEVRDTE